MVVVGSGGASHWMKNFTGGSGTRTDYEGNALDTEL